MSAGLVLLGVILVCVAFGYDTTVANTYTGGGTHNLGKLQMQMMILHTGLASIIVGTILSRGSASKTTSTTEAPSPEDEAERLRKLSQFDNRAIVIIGGIALVLIAISLSS